MILPAVLAAPFHVETFTVGGVARQALVFPGSGDAPKAGRPLVLAFHGHGGSMVQASRSFGVQTLWPEATVIYPDGLPTVGALTDPKGERQGWQKAPDESGDRDVKFVDAILAGRKGVDAKRVYAMGHSNGGRFTYVLWATRGDRFAAYGISGSPAGPLVRRFRPTSAFVTAGEADRLVPFASQNRTIDALAQLDGVDLSKGVKTGYVTLAKGACGLELGTYIHPQGHRYPPEAATATVALFKRHAR